MAFFVISVGRYNDISIIPINDCTQTTQSTQFSLALSQNQIRIPDRVKFNWAGYEVILMFNLACTPWTIFYHVVGLILIWVLLCLFNSLLPQHGGAKIRQSLINRRIIVILNHVALLSWRKITTLLIFMNFLVMFYEEALLYFVLLI